MSDHWEEVYWDREALDKMNISNIHWYLNDKVAKLESRHPVEDVNNHNYMNNNNNNHRHLVKSDNNDGAKDKKKNHNSFLVPMHGGIWTLCVSLAGKSILFIL